jgi:serine/threonine-protein kinase
MAAIAADRDLLFGLLALQNGLIQQAQLVAAFHAWTTDKARTLADHLVALGHLNPDQRRAIEAIAAIHLDAHGGEVERSLAAIRAGPATRAPLAALGEPEMVRTLTRVGSDPQDDDIRNAGYSVGAATSAAQRFRVLRPFDHGGLGAIFVALDEELHREVALKQILEHHADDPISRARFLLEAEITGRLEHPGIVPVYGLGADADGRPFYAMRFIQGDRLKEAVDRFHADASLRRDPGRRSLALRRLLRRFDDFCNAIEYAHSRGVLHRDIKPSNVILGKYGETLVVDWGLAKAVGRVAPQGDPGERTLVPSLAGGSAGTLPGGALGTPAYMSPEQAEGDLEHLGPRSDVYSLGATLYYLLTGRPPVAGDLGEMLGAVRRGDLKPSRQVDATIDPALEAVCLKAMAHRSADRYASPKALAEDVERWMADEPVSAWHEPPSRRARRWARRNRTAVTAAAVALIAGVVGLSAVLVVQAEAARSRAAAQARYELAVDAIKTFHTGVSEDFLLKQDQFKDLRDRLLRSAAAFYGKLRTRLGRETDVASRRAVAALNSELAVLTGKVGRTEAALAAHRSVLAAREALAAEPGAGAAAKADVGRSLTEVAALLEATGKTEEALAAYRRSESVLAGPADSDPAAREALASCRTKMGWLLYRTGRTAEAMAAYRRAQVDQEAMVAAPGATHEARRDLAETLNQIGILLSETGKPQEAEAAYRKALAIQEGLPEADPDAAEFRNGLAGTHFNLGWVLSNTGRPEEAEAEYRAALALRRKLAEEFPAVADFRGRLAAGHHNLGLQMSNTNRVKEAEPEFRAAVAACRKLVEDHPAVTEYRNHLATNLSCHANLLANVGRVQEAEEEHRAAVAVQRKLAEDHPDVINFRERLVLAHNRYSDMLSWAGRPAEAEAEYRAVVALQQKLAEDHPDVTDFRMSLAVSHNKLGLLLLDAGRTAAAEAEAEFRAAIGLCEELLSRGVEPSQLRAILAVSQLRMGMLRERTGDWDEAIERYHAAARLDDDPLGTAVSALAHLLGVAGRHDEAIALYRRLIAAHPRDLRGPQGLAEALFLAGRHGEAVRAFRDAVRMIERAVAAEPGSVQNRYNLVMALNGLGRLLQQMGRPSAAEAEYRRALAIVPKLEDKPNAAAYSDDAATTENNLSVVLRRLGRAAEARDHAERAVALREALLQEYPMPPYHPWVPFLRGNLAWTCLNRGLARRALGDAAGAVADIRRAVELDPVAGIRRAVELDPARPSWERELCFQSACARAALAGLAGEAAPGTSAAEAAGGAGATMALLREAVALGYRNPVVLLTEDALDPLRNRLDFRLLMMDLAFPAGPFAAAR